LEGGVTPSVRRGYAKLSMQLQDLLEIVDQFIPFEYAEEWDNPGLQVGSPASVIKKIMIALDPTAEALNQALEKGCQLVLTHHPLIFKALNRVVDNSYPGEIIYQAIKNDISIVSIHTNLDNTIEGINGTLAKLLGLREVNILIKKEGKEGAGLGVIGNLKEEMVLEKLIEDVKIRLRTDNIRMAGKGKRYIRAVAIIGGSGGGFIKEAKERGADILITGDIKFHDAQSAYRMGIWAMDAGHFNTERAGFYEFAKRLKRIIISKGFDVDFEYLEDKDPFSFYG